MTIDLPPKEACLEAISHMEMVCYIDGKSPTRIRCFEAKDMVQRLCEKAYEEIKHGNKVL